MNGLPCFRRSDWTTSKCNSGTRYSRGAIQPATRLSWSGWESSRKKLIESGQKADNPHADVAAPNGVATRFGDENLFDLKNRAGLRPLAQYTAVLRPSGLASALGPNRFRLPLLRGWRPRKVAAHPTFPRGWPDLEGNPSRTVFRWQTWNEAA